MKIKEGQLPPMLRWSRIGTGIAVSYLTGISAVVLFFRSVSGWHIASAIVGAIALCWVLTALSVRSYRFGQGLPVTIALCICLTWVGWCYPLLINFPHRTLIIAGKGLLAGFGIYALLLFTVMRQVKTIWYERGTGRVIRETDWQNAGIAGRPTLIMIGTVLVTATLVAVAIEGTKLQRSLHFRKIYIEQQSPNQGADRTAVPLRCSSAGHP